MAEKRSAISLCNNIYFKNDAESTLRLKLTMHGAMQSLYHQIDTIPSAEFDSLDGSGSQSGKIGGAFKLQPSNPPTER